MANKNKIIQYTIEHFEGTKYTNTAGDYGGPTKFGITLKTYSVYLGRSCTAKEVSEMVMETAIKIYDKNFWQFWNIDLYPDILQHLIFDLYVQHSPTAVGKIIQRGINLCGCKIAVDGVIGHSTLSSLVCLPPKQLLANIVVSRKNYYNSLVAKDPKQQKFIKGWLNRADWFLNNSLD